MPNEKVLSEKQQIVKELSEKLKGATAGVFVDYKGINVAEDTALRNELRKNNVEYTVIKNTLTRFAIKEVGMEELDPILNGTTSLAVSFEDAVLPAKVISDYSKKLGERFNIKAGFVDGKVISIDQVKALAELPSKDVMRATALGTLLAPITGLATVLNANIRGLAVALNQIKEQKESA